MLLSNVKQILENAQKAPTLTTNPTLHGFSSPPSVIYCTLSSMHLMKKAKKIYIKKREKIPLIFY
jgi:NifU-like protein involved in Fe-S cluster formation